MSSVKSFFPKWAKSYVEIVKTMTLPTLFCTR